MFAMEPIFKPDEFLKQLEIRPASIVLLGIGELGRKVLNTLRGDNIEVQYFCSLDSGDAGSEIERVEIISLDYLVRSREFYHIIIALPYSDRMKAVRALSKYQLNANVYVNYLFNQSRIETDGLMYDDVIGGRVIYDLVSWFKSNPWHFSEVYSDVDEYDDQYIQKVFSSPMNFIRGNLTRLWNSQSDYFNVSRGIRITTDAPEQYDNKVLMYGPCHVIGTGVDDGRTIASYLQRVINAEINDRIYSVKNYGNFSETMWDTKKRLYETDLHEGDIIILVDSRNNVKYKDECQIGEVDPLVVTHLMADELNEMNEYCKNRGAMMYIVNICSAADVKNPTNIETYLQNCLHSDIALSNLIPLEFDRDLLNKLCKENSIDVIEVKDAVQRPHEYGEIFINNTHFGPHGYRLIADQLFNCILSNSKHSRDELLNKERDELLNKERDELLNKEVTQLRNSIIKQEEEFFEQFSYAYYKKESANNELDCYLNKLRESSRCKPENAGVIVMNCNPFSRGHRYLVEKSLEQVDHLYVLVVEENQSQFSFEERFHMVQLGTADLENVTVIPSSKFVVSALTFPEYFGKDRNQDVQVDASTDIKIFCEKIVPILRVKKRFVGEEPYCKITDEYHKQIRETFPKYGIEFIEFSRLEIDGMAVSASLVRKNMQEGNFEVVEKLVPPTTYKYLLEMSIQPGGFI